MEEVDFSSSELSNAVFHECDLNGAIFENTNLEKADFSTAFHFSIEPDLNNIKKAKFSIRNVSGLLNKYNIQITD